MKDLSNHHLMFIEPVGEPKLVDDELTNQVRDLFTRCVIGQRWRGSHECSCGARSTSWDYVTPKGLLTNSLLVHYVQFHRDEIPMSELIKLGEEL